jgi:hypothetical protein
MPSREGIEIDQAELSLSAKPENLLVFLGLEERGHSGLTDIKGTLYAESDAPFEKLQEIWQHTLRVSPVANTLLRGRATKLGDSFP